VDKSEIVHRDQVIRGYFEGRNWDKNGEYSLKRKLILDSRQLFPNYSYVIEDEWEVEPGRTDQGCGDLVFTDGSGHFAVVEVKWIDLESTERTGSTKRGSNRKKRRKVEDQAIHYAGVYAELNLGGLHSDYSIEAFIFTNESDQPRSLPMKQP
jgi:hypothetical protein